MRGQSLFVFPVQYVSGMFCTVIPMVLNAGGRLCEMTKGHNKLFILKESVMCNRHRCMCTCVCVCTRVFVCLPVHTSLGDVWVSGDFCSNIKCLSGSSPVGPKQVASRREDMEIKIIWEKYRPEFFPEDAVKN